MVSTGNAPFFLFHSLALLNQELKEKFITSTIARYSSQQNKTIVHKLRLFKKRHLVTNVTQSVSACSMSTIETQNQDLKSV